MEEKNDTRIERIIRQYKKLTKTEEFPLIVRVTEEKTFVGLYVSIGTLQTGIHKSSIDAMKELEELLTG